MASTPEALQLTPGGMYPRSVTRSGRSRHSRRCQATFGRTDFRCHRCLELLQGAAPRGSFLSEYAARKRGELQRRLEF